MKTNQQQNGQSGLVYVLTQAQLDALARLNMPGSDTGQTQTSGGFLKPTVRMGVVLACLLIPLMLFATTAMKLLIPNTYATAPSVYGRSARQANAIVESHEQPAIQLDLNKVYLARSDILAKTFATLTELASNELPAIVESVKYVEALKHDNYRRYVSDRLDREVRDEIIANFKENIDISQMSVSVFKGKVIISGTARNADELRFAGDTAWLPAVTDVDVRLLRLATPYQTIPPQELGEGMLAGGSSRENVEREQNYAHLDASRSRR